MVDGIWEFMTRAQKRGKKSSGVLIKRVILEKINGIFVGTETKLSVVYGCPH